MSGKRRNPVADTPLAKKIEERLLALGMGQRRAAVRAGVGVDFVRSILDGRTRSPRTEDLRKLAGALGVTLNDLLEPIAEGQTVASGPTDIVDPVVRAVRAEAALGLIEDTLRRLLQQVEGLRG